MGLRATLPNHIPACRCEFVFHIYTVSVKKTVATKLDIFYNNIGFILKRDKYSKTRLSFTLMITKGDNVLKYSFDYL